MSDLANRVHGAAKPIPVRGLGTYLRWMGGSGEQLWLQLDESGEGVGMNPHFSGESRLPVAVNEWVRDPRGTALDGSLHGWADPQQPVTGDKPGDFGGWYPLTFDMPDAALARDLPVPAKLELQVAAFAHELKVFASEAAYREGVQGKKNPMAVRSFIPSGHFGEGPPRAEGFFTGVVEKAAVKTNVLTGLPFHWALVDTLGGKYDVVVDPALVSGPLQVGKVVQGVFWFSARIAGNASMKKRGVMAWLKGKA